jgi:hypothetical protein
VPFGAPAEIATMRADEQNIFPLSPMQQGMSGAGGA